MRNILFRGKRIDNGEWAYGYYSEFHNRPTVDMPNSCQIFVPDENAYFCGSSIGGLWHVVDSETVGQFTGVYDYNGKRIFEGDIVRDAFLDDFIVEFDSGCLIATERNPKGMHQATAKLSDLFTVVGNIYEQKGESV